jgi:hypothetical protein
MLLAVLSIIAWVSSMPLDLTVTLIGLVVGIDCELLLLPFPFAGALAGILTAIALILYPRVGIKDASTMGSCALNL